ncbi:MAG: hypothetical protein HY052_05395 [Proteobacteria bacterium]|nr:hypothetical protein [Pseudomonadota bacterium]
MFLGYRFDAVAAKITLIWALGFVLLVITSFWYCDNHLIYSLDDPYIHLAVARNILLGNYGVNVHEASSPSSSVLWPWILTFTEFLGLKSAGPLFLNIPAALATVYVTVRLVEKLGLINQKTDPIVSYGLGIILILVTSALALPMTGMEHSWHVLTVVLILDGLISASHGRSPGWVFLAALVAAPLLRFEGGALSLSVIVSIWFLGYRRAALGAALTLGFVLTVYAFYMVHLGLPIVPSSVLTKSAVVVYAVENYHLAWAILYNFSSGIHTERGLILLVSMIYLLFTAFKQKDRKNSAYVYIPLIFSILAHLLMGDNFNWEFRYEVYITALAFLGIIFSFSSGYKPPEQDKSLLARQLILLGLGLLLFAGSNVISILVTPQAARGIYKQQYQMHRFVRDYYHSAVAVNDIGLVSYGNDNFVLDLWGLGSERVRLLSLFGKFDQEAMAKLVDDHEVRLIMVYEKWFRQGLPKNWLKIAQLRTGRQITSGGTDVSFFITPKADKASVLNMLREFASSLPKEDKLIIFERS